jgi:hypothetical protein
MFIILHFANMVCVLAGSACGSLKLGQFDFQFSVSTAVNSPAYNVAEP